MASFIGKFYLSHGKPGKYSKNFQKYSKKFQGIFENFLKISSENCKKCIILAYFSKNLTNHALIFCALGPKRQFTGHFENALF